MTNSNHSIQCVSLVLDLDNIAISTSIYSNHLLNSQRSLNLQGKLSLSFFRLNIDEAIEICLYWITAISVYVLLPVDEIPQVPDFWQRFSAKLVTLFSF